MSPIMQNKLFLSVYRMHGGHTDNSSRLVFLFDAKLCYIQQSKLKIFNGGKREKRYRDEASEETFYGYLAFAARWESYERSGYFCEGKKSTARRHKEERSIKPTLLYRAYSMLSRGDISGNWKFPVENAGRRGAGPRTRLAGRKRDLSHRVTGDHYFFISCCFERNRSTSSEIFDDSR